MPKGLDAVAGRVRVALGGPAERERADSAPALEKESLGLLGRQMWLDPAHRLEVLPTDDAVVWLQGELGFQPFRAHERNIAASEHLRQIAVERTQLALHLGVEADVLARRAALATRRPAAGSEGPISVVVVVDVIEVRVVPVFQGIGPRGAHGVAVRRRRRQVRGSGRLWLERRQLNLNGRFWDCLFRSRLHSARV
jgi:hypothetical protein